MVRQILSQDELNALLRGADSAPQLSPLQKDALGEIGNITYGSAATALSEMLNRKVVIDAPTVFIFSQQDLKEQHPIPYVIIEVIYQDGLLGSNVLIMKIHDAALIADLMLGYGGTTPNETLGEMELSAIGESMNQMVGSAATSLSTLFSRRVEIHPPKVRVVDLASEESIISGCALDEKIAVVSFKLQIEGLTNSELMLLLPIPSAIEMTDSLLSSTINSRTITDKVPIPPQSVIPSVPSKPLGGPGPTMNHVPTPAEIPEPIIMPAAAAASVGPSHTPSILNIPPRTSYNQRQEVHSPVMVQPAQFGPISTNKNTKEPANIGLILDVPLEVTVELGNTKMRIKEILELGIGSVIELDKLAGDPVDIYANGKLIAKGEVVVIDENFGIKVTDIISPMERANTLQ